jgi:phenylalanyl-tRNA synthetase beta subunit
MPKYPESRVDLCVEAEDEIRYKDLYDVVFKEINNDDMKGTVSCIDIYKANEKATMKRITFGIAVKNFNKTLNDKDIKVITEKIIKQLEKTYSVKII